MPVYAMQTVKIPASVCDTIEKMSREFLWGDSRKVHLANWDLVCKPKRFGGLGIKNIRHMNQAMLAKVGWRMFQNDEGLWSMVLHQKYVKDIPLLHSENGCSSRSSSTWRSIIHGIRLLKEGLVWRIGDGSSANFWKDKWVTDDPLLHHTLNQVAVNSCIKVKDCWNDGEWDLNFLKIHFCDDIVNRIVRTPPGFQGCGPDRMIWGGTSNGHFTVKSAYLYLVKEENIMEFPWFFFWKLPIPPKLKYFFWLVCHGKLLTNVERVKRRFATNCYCPVCNEQPETILHLLRDCPVAKRIWNSVICLDSISRTMQLDWYGWFFANSQCRKICYGNLQWCSIFVYTCWHIWKWRNKKVFDEGFHFPFNPGKVVIDSVREWKSANTLKPQLSSKTYVSLFWKKPPEHYFKLNVDGARNLNGKIGAGGVLRDFTGAWISGFYANLGCGSVLQAEAWGLLLGLQMALSHQCQHLLVESDSHVLVSLVQQDVDDLHPLKTIIDCCQALQRQLHSCDLKHIYREVNQVADILSKVGLDAEIGTHLMEQPPPQVNSSLLDDLCESPKIRIINSEL